VRSKRPDDRRVVITGLGTITPLGLSTPELWDGLVNGRSGVGPITQFDASDFPTRIAGEVKDFDPGAYMNPKEARRMARCSQLAVATVGEALEDAGLTLPFQDAARVGVLVGTGLGGIDKAWEVAMTLCDRGWSRVNPFSAIAALDNMPSHHVSQATGATGPNLTVVTACATGTSAIGEAAEIIRRGAADAMICGGVDGQISAYTLASFSVMRLLSTCNDEPERASRPFDQNRDGFVMSEGCGLIVLESLEHARRRGARIYAEVLGQSSSSDANHIAEPDPAGAERTMRWALEDAGLDADEVDYINAHGPATLTGDAVETLAIKKVFGARAYAIPVSSTKSMIGHCMGGAGAIEAVVCALTISHGVIHQTLNYETPDPDCDLDYVPGAARERPVRVALSNSFGLGGQNACLILGRFE
jgi:3-oxoacyl-[acyl-carrier-protein] synthase II